MPEVDRSYFKKRNNRTLSGTLFYWLFAAATLILSVIFLGMRLASPSDGARQEPGEQGLTPDGLQIKTIVVQPGGLRDGDVVIAVAGRSLEDWLKVSFQSLPSKPDWLAGDTIHYTILRDGIRMEVPVRLVDYPLLDILARSWSTLLFVLISQVVITLVFVLNPREIAIRSLFIWAWSLSHTYVWSLGLQVSDFTNGFSFLLYQICTGFLWFIFWGAFLHFVLTFPHIHTLVIKFPSLKAWSYLLPFIGAFIFIFVPGPAVNALEWLRRLTVSEWVTGAWATLVWLIILLEGYRHRFSFTEKKKVRWIFLSGLVCGGLGFVFFLLPASILNQSIIPGHLLGLVLIPFPICLAISVVRHQLFDIDIIIRRTLLYSILTLVLSLAYFAGILLLQSLFQSLTGQANQLAIVISTVGIASIANPLRKWFQRSIDRRFFRGRYNSEQALAAFVKGARDEVDLTQLSSQLSIIVLDSLQPMYVSIWLKKVSREKSGLDRAMRMLLELNDEGNEESKQSIIFPST